MRRRFFITASLALLAVSCTVRNTAVVEVRVCDAPDSSFVTVYRPWSGMAAGMDTVFSDNGSFRYEADIPDGAPELYYFSVGGGIQTPVVLYDGDRVVLDIGADGTVTGLSGSEESLKMIEFNRKIGGIYSMMDSVSARLIDATAAGDGREERRLLSEMGSLYMKCRREAIGYIYDNPHSITLIPVVYMDLADGLPLFSGTEDMFIRQMVYDSLSAVYPTSGLVKALADDLERARNGKAFEDRLSKAGTVGYPDIALPGVDGNVSRLSDLGGKTVVLVFWNAGDDNQKMWNNELKSIYSKYGDRGLEVYQVAVGPDKAAWARQVRVQGLPWVNVYDNGGLSSVNALSYNVSSLPAVFLITSSGDIVGRNILNPRDLENSIAGLIG